MPHKVFPKYGIKTIRLSKLRFAIIDRICHTVKADKYSFF